MLTVDFFALTTRRALFEVYPIIGVLSDGYCPYWLAKPTHKAVKRGQAATDTMVTAQRPMPERRRQFETGFTFTVKILNGCLVLIPDSEDIRAIKQQKQQQQAQLSEIRLRLCKLTMEYSND
ncbi:hypothetical protein [Proteus mirabilis]